MNMPETHWDLLRDHVKAYAMLATIMEDGTPQVTPVWFNWDGADILINSAEGRVKDRNMRARPDVAVCIFDPANMQRYIQVRGKVIEVIRGADEHINQLSLKYTGDPIYAFRAPEEVRVMYRICPEHVTING
jgi:PPOX class probable F420-dependent enzyme